MTMFLKLMAPDDAADDDSRKGQRLISGVAEVEFTRSKSNVPYANVMFDDGTRKEIELVGNAYVMNADGKTIDSFGMAAIPRRRRLAS